MRKLLLPVVVAMIGVTLVIATPPAMARKRHWHTVMKSFGAHVQACRGKHESVYFRVNNKHGKRWGSFKERETVNGHEVGGGSISAFAPHSITSVIGGGGGFGRNVVHMTLKLDKNKHHKRVKKHRVRGSHKIARC